MRYLAVISDIDGTLIQTDRIIIQSAVRGAKEAGFSKKEVSLIRRKFRSQFGLNSDIMFSNILPKKNRKEILKADSLFHKYLLPLYKKSRTFPHVKRVFASLKKQGIKLGVCTSSSTNRIKSKFRQVGLKTKFDVLLGKDKFPRPRPAPDSLLKACRMLKVRPREAIYVGDTIFDIETGKRAGCYTLAFRLGRKPRGYRPDRVMTSWKQFPKIFERLNK